MNEDFQDEPLAGGVFSGSDGVVILGRAGAGPEDTPPEVFIRLVRGRNSSDTRLVLADGAYANFRHNTLMAAAEALIDTRSLGKRAAASQQHQIYERAGDDMHLVVIGETPGDDRYYHNAQRFAMLRRGTIWPDPAPVYDESRTFFLWVQDRQIGEFKVADLIKAESLLHSLARDAA